MTRSPANGRTGALLICSGNGIPVVLSLFLIVLASLQAQAQDESQILLPSEGTVVLGPDDTLELVLRTRAHLTAADAVPELRAWLLATDQPGPGEGEKSQGRVLTVPSTTRPGEWLAHIRGLKPPKADRAKAWDLLLRWNAGADEKFRGEVRLKGAVAFREGQPDVVLLLDGSLSMGRTDPKRLRVEASRAFVALSRASGGIGRIGLVQFDDKARTILPLTPLEQAAAIEQGLEKIGESGETDIDGGVRRALEVLKGDREQAAGAIVLLTDGKQEPGEYKDAHALARAANVPVHTVALGRDADRALLRRIAADTGGTFADAVRDQDLMKMYASIADKIAGGRTILSIEMTERGGTAEFPVDGACRTLALSATARGNGALALSGPGSAAQRSGIQPHPLLFQMAPATGSWKAEWTPEGNGAATVNASAQTPLYPLFFRARTDAKGEVEIDPDEPRIALSMMEGAGPAGAADVTVTLAFSHERAPLTVRLFDDGKHDDGTAGDGVFAGDMDALRDARIPTDAGGAISAVIQGTRQGAEAFRREVRANWALKRSGARALLTSGAANLGEHWSGSIAEGRVSLRVRGQGGVIAVEASADPKASAPQPNLAEYLELVDVPEKLPAGGRGEVSFRVRIPEGTPEGAYAGMLKITLNATPAEPAIVVTVPWRVRVRPAQLAVEPARLDLGELPPGETVARTFKLATRGGVLTIAPPGMADPASFLKFRDPRRRLLPSSIYSGSTPRALELNSEIAGLMRIGTEPVDFVLAFAVPQSATAGRIAEMLVLRDRFGGVAARIPVEVRVTPLHLDLPDEADLGKLEPGDETEHQIIFPMEGAQARGVAQAPAVVRVTSDHGAAAEPLWIDSEHPGSGSIRLRLSAQARRGTIGGWLSFEAGPALGYRRWEARVVEPSLTPDVSSIDLGTLMPGQRRAKSFLATFAGARSTFLAARLSEPPHKPKLRQIAFAPEFLLAHASKSSLLPNDASKIDLDLHVPDAAQDGAYEAKIALDSRLGSVVIPVRFHVAASVPHPPFHVSPAEVTLRVVNGAPDDPAEVVITSHSDEDLLLSTRIEPAEGFTRGCVDLLSAPGAKAEQALAVVLPGRGETRLLLRAWPDARSEECCRLTLEGAGERQSVEIAIQAVNDPRMGLGGRRSGESFFDWLRFLVLLLLVLLILLVRALSRKRWVRYVTYALAFHAAIMFLSVPSTTIVGSLPESMQFTLLSTQEQLGFELSPEQERRLAALGAGAEAPAAGEAPKDGGAPAAPGRDAELAAAQAQAAAPAAEGAMAQAQAEDARKASAAPDEPRRTEREADPDKALAAETLEPAAPRAPEPAPAAHTVSNDPVEAPLVMKDASRAELPSQEPRETRAPAPNAAAALTQATTAPAKRTVATLSPEPASARPTREAPSAEDLPLVSDIPESPSASASQSASNPDAPVHRDTPAQAVAVASPSKTAKLDTAGQAKTISANKPQGAARASGWVASASGISYGSGSNGQGFTKHGGGAHRAAGMSSGDAADGALEASATAKTSGAGGGGTQTADGRDADGTGPAAPRGTPGGWGLASGGTGKSGTSAGTDAMGTGSAVNGKPGAKGWLPGLGEGMGLGGSERLALGGKKGTGKGAGQTEGRGTGRGDGDAPLATNGWGKGVGGQGTAQGKGPAIGEGGQGREHAAGIGLGLTGTGSGAGGTLAALGEKGTGPRWEGAGGFGSTFAGFELGLQRPSIKSIQRLSGRGTGAGGDRPVWGPADGLILRVTLGLAKHAADWNSSPTALHNLATAFKERCGLPDVESTVRTVALTDRAALAACRVILITSNDPIAFTPSERDGLRAYIAGGGTVWVNDSSASGDERFDAAFQRDLPTIVPGARLEKIDAAHALFRSAYDLSRGYKGYRVPPGDKYRLEYVEALAPDKPGGRIGLIYTRNDYADGLEIDPRSIAGRPSLTDLSPDEMLEGSLRFGINVVAYALGAAAPRMPPPPESTAQAAKLYRYSGPELPAFEDFSKANNLDGNPIWSVEDWGNPATLTYSNIEKGRALSVAFKKGAKSKSAVTREVSLDLSKAKSLVLDLYSSLPHGFNVALLFQTRPGWIGYECRPVYVKPGWNRNLRFPLDLDDFKSAKNEWKSYDQPFAQRGDVAKLSVLLYNLESGGEALIGNLRVEK